MLLKDTKFLRLLAALIMVSSCACRAMNQPDPYNDSLATTKCVSGGVIELTVPNTIDGKDPHSLVNYPLLLAACKDDIDQVQKELISGRNVNVRDSKHHLTALHYAVFNTNAALVKLLIHAGVHSNARSVYGHTPLDIAKEKLQSASAYGCSQGLITTMREIVDFLEKISIN